MGHLARMDLFFQEGNVQESSQPNRVSPKPPFPRDRAPPANRDRGLWGLEWTDETLGLFCATEEGTW